VLFSRLLTQEFENRLLGPTIFSVGYKPRAAVWGSYRAPIDAALVTRSWCNPAPFATRPCTGGTGRGPGTRNLLDLFQVAIDPQDAKTAIIYVDDTLTTSSNPYNFTCSPSQQPPCPLPQAVLAQQN
jgi:hypothetical protein